MKIPKLDTFNKNREAFVLGFMVVFVTLLWWGSFVITTKYVNSLPSDDIALDKSLDRSSKIGDLFGSVNALFSAFAFVGLFFTIYLQKKEIEKSREEFIKLYNAQQFQNTFTLNSLKIEALKALVDAAKVQAEYNPNLQETSSKQILKLVGKIGEISESLKKELNMDEDANTSPNS